MNSQKSTQESAIESKLDKLCESIGFLSETLREGLSPLTFKKPQTVSE